MTEPDALAARLSNALGPGYTLDAEIGRGGMGVVYGARDERLKRRVAVKVLPPELAYHGEIRTRFLREAETAARLSHPHIVPIHSVGEGPDGIVYFVMAYVDGEALGARLKRRGRLAPDEARRIMIEAADALGAAHAVGIIHRDVKPDNILLEGSRGRVVVTDFGIAKALSTASGMTLTATGVAIGTPHYMSPEQAAGDREIDGRADLYSLGVVGYQMLVGELPFHAPTVPGILVKQLTEEAPLVSAKRPDCPADLAAAVARCLAKDPDDRWPTAEGLRRALESRTATAPKPAPLARRPPPSLAPVVKAARVEPRRAQGDRAPTPPEAPVVQRARATFVRWAMISGPLVLINLTTGRHIPSWSLAVSGVLAAIWLVPRYVRLWQAGYSWRDVLARPPAPDAVEARAREEGDHNEFGAGDAAVRQARDDRRGILRILEKLPASERKLMPDIAGTADLLLRRAEELARLLHSMSIGVDDGALAMLDAKVAAITSASPGAERDRQRGLLQRRRDALAELLGRRRHVAAQLESCGLAMQNVRYDLLRLRSAGVAAVLDDLTLATDQARALSRDVDHAIAAAGEVRAALEPPPLETPPAP